ncbi:MAG: GvpL/GvpF family gas vesicle protein [Chlorobiales bacterium]|nr:GvpL/GvpF family gas vesicle protein [Chlorobiales bacterium]
MSQENGLYIYCIISSPKAVSFGDIGIGGRCDEVRTIAWEDIHAVVSQAPLTKYDTSRENIMAHEFVIETVMKDYAVLPLRFATVMNDESDVRHLLKAKYEKCVEELERVEGKVELGVKAIAKKDVVFEEILLKNDDIRTLKEKIQDIPYEKTYYDRLAIGKMVENALEDEKKKYQKIILETLEPVSLEMKENKNFGDRMIVNASFLVDKEEEGQFDDRVNELGEKYGDKIIFKYVGGIPPYSFVNFSL